MNFRTPLLLVPLLLVVLIWAPEIGVGSVAVKRDLNQESRAVHVIWGQNRTQDGLIRVMAFACKFLHIESSQLCRLYASDFREEILYVVDQVIFQPKKLCALLVSNCGAAVNPLFPDWTVEIPGGKPPVESPPNPPANAPKLKVLQIADLHIDPLYQTGSEAACGHHLCCRENATDGRPKQPAGYWGTIGMCDIPSWTVENMFEQITRNHPDIDFIIWTGDLAPHNSYNYTRHGHITEIRKLGAMFLRHFANIPLFSAVGNHEGVPANSFPPSYVPDRYGVQWLYNLLNEQWGHWLPPSTASSIHQKASYVVSVHPGLKLISINTEYSDPSNFWLFINQTDPEGLLAWLVDHLTLAERDGDKVYIIGHTPSGNRMMLPTWSQNYYKIVNRFENTIRGQFFGHTHRDAFSVFYEDANQKKRPTNMLYISPSVTTWEWHPRNFLSPAYRIYTVDGNYPGSTRAVLNHETYAMNITDANLSGEPKWTLEYSAKHSYGLSDLNPGSWNDFINRMRIDDGLFYRYVQHYSRSDNATCEGSCRYELLCEARQAMSWNPKLCSDLGQFALPPL